MSGDAAIVVERRGAISRKQLDEMYRDGDIAYHSISRYSKQHPSRQQKLVGRNVVFFSEGFENAHKIEQIEGHYVSGVCVSVQTVYPTICQKFCDGFPRCYKDGSDLREVMKRKGITLELQPHQGSQSSSLGSILRQARITARHTRPDSS